MIIAVDYDGTIFRDGKVNETLVSSLQAEQRKGSVIILWTCREGESLSEAVKTCALHGLRFNYINENCPAAISMLGRNPRKIFADVYIDDKAMR